MKNNKTSTTVAGEWRCSGRGLEAANSVVIQLNIYKPVEPPLSFNGPAANAPPRVCTVFPFRNNRIVIITSANKG
jgi:hypothetical protein